jgi:hypothetical protein
VKPVASALAGGIGVAARSEKPTARIVRVARPRRNDTPLGEVSSPIIPLLRSLPGRGRRAVARTQQGTGVVHGSVSTPAWSAVPLDGRVQPRRLEPPAQPIPGPNLAEADGNRTRLPALAGTPILKFGDGRVVGCYLIPPGAIQSRSAALFVPSGAFSYRLVMSWMFATCLQATQAMNDDFCRRWSWTAAVSPELEAPLGAKESETLTSALRVLADPARLRLVSPIASQPSAGACVRSLTDPLGRSGRGPIGLKVENRRRDRRAKVRSVGPDRVDVRGRATIRRGLDERDPRRVRRPHRVGEPPGVSSRRVTWVRYGRQPGPSSTARTSDLARPAPPV